MRRHASVDARVELPEYGEKTVQRDDDEKQADVMIGEAVMGMFDDDAPVTTASLLVKLRLMQMTENDARRKKAIFCAIREINSAPSGAGAERRHGKDKARREAGRLSGAVLSEVSRKH